MGIEIIFLILAVLVVTFGIGVVVLNRRREGVQQPPARPVAPPIAPGSTLVEDRPVTDASVDELVVEEPVVEEPPAGTLRERLAKARSTFAGAISGVLGRPTITEESFEELEEALLRADIGIVSLTNCSADCAPGSSPRRSPNRRRSSMRWTPR